MRRGPQKSKVSKELESMKLNWNFTEGQRAQTNKGKLCDEKCKCRMFCVTQWAQSSVNLCYEEESFKGGLLFVSNSQQNIN